MTTNNILDRCAIPAVMLTFVVFSGHQVYGFEMSSSLLSSRFSPPVDTENTSKAFMSTELVEDEQDLGQPGVKLPSEIIYKDERGFLEEVDSLAMLQRRHNHPIKSDKLIEMTKSFIESNLGVNDPSLLTDDYSFVGQTVGPYDKTSYLRLMGSSGINPLVESFPDHKGNHYGFVVDPLEEGRVWWITRPMGTFTGGPYRGVSPNGRVCQPPPQSMGVIISHDGKIRHCSLSGPLDRSCGNTGGVGGVFGFTNFVGKPFPFPEAKPFKRSWQFRWFDYRMSWVIRYHQLRYRLNSFLQKRGRSA